MIQLVEFMTPIFAFGFMAGSCESLFRTTGGREGHTHEAFNHIAPS